MLFEFFFFKQKTAYEMRISDWSSDVCSSDLIDAVSGDLAALAEENEPIGTVPVFNDIQAFMNFAAEGLLAQIPAQEDRLDRAAQLTQRLVGRVHHLGAAIPAQDRLQIGRASCRERVCQYV